MTIIRRLRAALVISASFGLLWSAAAIPYTIVLSFVNLPPALALGTFGLFARLVPAFFLAGAIVGFLFSTVLALGSKRVAINGRLKWLAAAGAIGGVACMAAVTAFANVRLGQLPIGWGVLSAAAGVYAVLGAGTAAIIGKIAGWRNRKNDSNDSTFASPETAELNAVNPLREHKTPAERTHVLILSN
jgi:hypothetical protein